MNIILNRNGWGNCKDSTSVLSTEQRYFPKGNPTAFKIDLAIVHESRSGWERLIHHKTGIVHFDQWYWNQTPNSDGLTEKVEDIKADGLWPEVRRAYLDKKNLYLRRNDHNHPSFIVYLETINEIYYKYFG